MLKISIITVCFNSATTISKTLRSVATQSYSNVEHIVVDGASTDETMNIVREFGARVTCVISEPDQGIYDAMNKGFSMASGDLVGFLNSDDHYVDAKVLEDVAVCGLSDCDYIYGDLLMINNAGRIVRNWKTGIIPSEGLTGNQIPHPVLFVRKHVLESISPVFDTTYRISADLKQQLVFINQRGAKGTYIPRSLTAMSLGGTSTASLASYISGWRESTRAYNEVFGGGGLWFTFKKVFSKIKGLRVPI